MKVGILGTGKIVQEFLPWLVEHAPFTVQALCSTPRSAEKAQELCRQYGVPQHTTNYLELLQWWMWCTLPCPTCSTSVLRGWRWRPGNTSL